MASNITLFKGNSSEKETDYYPSNIYPVAFLSDDYAGIRATDDENIDFSSSEHHHRGILAAIRGAYLAQELNYVSPLMLDSCFCACINQPNDAQRIVAEIVKKHIKPLKLKDAQLYVPNDISQILSNLDKEDILFDGNEIEFELKRGIIKKSNDIEDILMRTKKSEMEVDEEEYGWEISLDEMNEDMKLDINENRVVRPFLDTYLDRCNRKIMRIATYTTSNTTGYCILSKLRRQPNMDFEFVVNFRSDYFGHVNQISMDIGISPMIKFRKSSEKVKMEFFSKEILEQCYGKQFKPSIMQKMPFVFRPDDAAMYMDGPNLMTRVLNLELAKITHPIFNSIRQRFLYTKKYGINQFN